MNKKIFRFLFFVVLLLTVISCKKTDSTSTKLREAEATKLQNYIETNNISEDYKKPSGLYFIPVEEGTGDSIKIGETVKIWYNVTSLDGDPFDASGYDPFEFVVGSSSVILGLNEAITYMKQGGKATLIIPSDLAYGSSGTYDIPGYTTLLFDVEVYRHYTN